MSDPFQATRAALAAPRSTLEAGQATNQDFQTYIRLVEERSTPGHKHYDGDAPGAVQSLRQLLANLVPLKAAPKATATGVERLDAPATELEFLPGVTEAVSGVRKAIELLRWLSA
jgi:hypothetical protein